MFFFYANVYLFKIFMINKQKKTSAQFNFDPVQLIFWKIWPSRKLLLMIIVYHIAHRH